MDGGEHRGTSQVLEWLDACPRFARVQLPAPPAFAVGDLLAFRLGRVAHHVGLVTGRHTFIHAMRNYGVIESRLDDPTFAKRFVALYRPVR
jgi:cell wall-associated NlpC family hydrolase